MKIKELPTVYRSDKTTRNLVERDGDVAIYKCVHDEAKTPHWEVIQIRTTRPHPRDPNPEGFDLVEFYPSSGSWGVYGWTCLTYADARKRQDLVLGKAQTGVLKAGGCHDSPQAIKTPRIGKK